MGEILQTLFGNILMAVLIPVAAAVGLLLATLIKKAISKIDSEAIQAVAWQAVLFAEQKFKDMHGKDKFDKAYEYVAGKLPGVSKEDIEKAVEAAVGAMNKEFPKAPSSSTNP